MTPAMQAAYKALCAEILASGTRNDPIINSIEKCFCIACKGLTWTIQQQQPKAENKAPVNPPKLEHWGV